MLIVWDSLRNYLLGKQLCINKQIFNSTIIQGYYTILYASKDYTTPSSRDLGTANASLAFGQLRT